MDCTKVSVARETLPPSPLSTKEPTVFRLNIGVLCCLNYFQVHYSEERNTALLRGRCECIENLKRDALRSHMRRGNKTPP